MKSIENFNPNKISEIIPGIITIADIRKNHFLFLTIFIIFWTHTCLRFAGLQTVTGSAQSAPSVNLSRFRVTVMAENIDTNIPIAKARANPRIKPDPK